MIKIFADGADKAGMLSMYNNPRIDGFTTNPSLMRLAGAKNYKKYSIRLAKICKKKTSKPIFYE